ncbi:MAG: tetratricopeptide repeat protein [Microscillaceae bacterium]|jgi:signal transduction histidine kinase|nr:tetratricopeptide repeat protein [Microscillaceae bacterium]
MKITLILILVFCFSLRLTAQVKIPELLGQLRQEKIDTSRIKIYNSLAQAYLFSKPDSSLYFGQQGFELAQKINYPLGKALTINSLGNVYRLRGDLATATNYFNQALGLAKDLKNRTLEATAYHNLAITNFQQGNYPKALEFNLNALKIREAVQDLKGVSTTLNNISIVYIVQENYNLALEYAFKSLKIHEKSQNKAGYSSSYITVGLIYKYMGNFAEASKYFEQALPIKEELQDRQSIGLIYGYMGEICRVRKEYPQAIEYTLKDLQIKQELRNQEGIADNYRSLADLYFETQQYQLSEDYAQRAQAIAKLYTMPLIEEPAHWRLAQIYKIQKKYEAVNYHYERYIALKDSLFNLNKAKEIAKLQSGYDLGKKQQEIALLAKDREIQRFEAERKQKLIALLEVENQNQKIEAEKRALAMKLLNQDKFLQAEELQAKQKELRFQQKQAKIQAQLLEKQQAEIRYQNRLRDALFVILALMGLIFIIILRNYRKSLRTSSLLQAQNREIQSQKEDLSHKTEELGKLNQVKSRMLSIISHDVRGPLGVIKGTLDLFQDDLLNESELKKISGELENKVDFTLSLLDNLLYWARSQMSNFVPQPQNIDLIHLLEKNIQFFAALAQEKKVMIEATYLPNVQGVADSNMIDLVIRNLLANAIKFSPENSQINLSVAQDDKFATICVQDEGVGISPENQKKLLNGMTTYTTRGTANEPGTGLGLVLCKDFVERNGGKLWLESEEGKGSKFQFTVPLAM